MLIIGLTGGVASGKNSVASHFVRLKIPVFDADLEVHKLLLNNKKVFREIKDLFPNVVEERKINRKILGEEVFDNKVKLKKLEQIIYPFLKKQEDLFIKNCQRNHKEIVVLNIPLLFEKGSYKRCNKNIVVTTSPQIQFQRFKNRLKSQGINDLSYIDKRFYNIINYQISDAQRRKRADFIIYNGLSKFFTFIQLKRLVLLLKSK